MKLHIENLNITLQQPQPGLLATMAIAHAACPTISRTAPQIGEKWPGTEATYAGVSLSLNGDRLVYLLLWGDDDAGGMDHSDAIKHAEAINPAMASHLPTRHQGITLFENLPNLFSKNHAYWLITLTPSGKAAFCQDFDLGLQGYDVLSAECRVRAVSEIPL